MTKNEYDALRAGLSSIHKLIMGEADKGPVTAPRLRPLSGRINGHTEPLHALMAMGLLRQDGFDPTARHKTKQYVAVPPGEVEAAAKVYAERAERASTQPKRQRNPVRQRIADLPKRVEGDRLYAMRVRRHTLMLVQHLVALNREVVFWDEGTPDEWAFFVDDLVLLMDALGGEGGIFDKLDERVTDDVLRAKIAKLRETHGRTVHEVLAADGLARKLERQRKATG
jgi:hypothetical protein